MTDHKYPIAEIFYSLKGEGLWTGKPMAFVRFAGCNLKCEFCDTDHSVRKEMTSLEIFKEVSKYPTSRLVLTGGEPCIQNLQPLINLLSDRFTLHIETNGMLPVPSGISWITVSPKNDNLNNETMDKCNEVKFLYAKSQYWVDLITSVRAKYGLFSNGYRELILMPIAVGKYDKEWSRDANAFIDDNVRGTIEYCLRNPEFRYQVQLHKVLNVR